jgi:hypothetical protein
MNEKDLRTKKEDSSFPYAHLVGFMKIFASSSKEKIISL